MKQWRSLTKYVIKFPFSYHSAGNIAESEEHLFNISQLYNIAQSFMTTPIR
jgi:hypothetical protein